MQIMKAKQVINGSFGEAWVNSDYMADVTGVEAVIDIDFEDINQPRKLSTGKKMIGWQGSGSLKFNKTTSRFIKMLGEDLRAGRQTEVDIITKLDDPDSIGAERIVLKNVTFENLTIANWEAKTAGNDEAPFFFDEWQPLDLI